MLKPSCSSKSIIFLLCFSSFCILSNHKLLLVRNYVPKMVIIFAFFVVSLLWTSRYVLIDISNLTHFLCCNLFVIFVLDTISDFHECFGNSLTITVNYSVQMANTITIPCYSDFRECFQNSRELPCGDPFL